MPDLMANFQKLLREYGVYPYSDTPKEYFPGQGGEASIFQGERQSLDPTGAIMEINLLGKSKKASSVLPFPKKKIPEMGQAEAFLNPWELLSYIKKGLGEWADIGMPRIEKYTKKMMLQAEKAGQPYNEGLHKSYITSAYKLYDQQRLGELGNILTKPKILPLINKQIAKGKTVKLSADE